MGITQLLRQAEARKVEKTFVIVVKGGDCGCMELWLLTSPLSGS
jgi:hypothetical protein